MTERYPAADSSLLMMVRRRLVIAFGVLVLLAAGVIGATLWSKSRQTTELNRVLSRAGSAGLITTVEELRATLAPHNPEALDAWNATEKPAYLQVLPKAVPGTNQSWSQIFDQMLLGTADLEVAALLLKEAEPDLARIRHAASFNPFVPEKNWSEGYSVLFPELAIFRTGAKSLAASAVHRARIGEADAAIRDFQSCARIIAIESVQPLIIGRLVYAASLSSFVTAMQTAAGHLARNEKAIEQLLVIANSIPAADFQIVLGQELTMARVGIRQIMEGLLSASAIIPDSNGGGGPADDFLLRRGAKDAEIILINHFVDLFEAWPDLQRIKVLEKALEQRGDNKYFDPGGALAAMLAPYTSPFVVRSQTARGQLAAMKVGLAAVQLRAKSGEWPTLDEAAEHAGMDPVDPFTGDKLRYVATKGELRVYSVGENKIDEGGKASGNADRNSRHDDWARFIVRLPAGR